MSIRLGLSPKTVALMLELFGDKVCCACGGPAQRLLVKSRTKLELFYCQDCYVGEAPPMVLTPKTTHGKIK